jgi:hypothetical protein
MAKKAARTPIHKSQRKAVKKLSAKIDNKRTRDSFYHDGKGAGLSEGGPSLGINVSRGKSGGFGYTDDYSPFNRGKVAKPKRATAKVSKKVMKKTEARQAARRKAGNKRVATVYGKNKGEK